MRRQPPSGGSPLRALVAGIALLVGLQWYGPGGYAHIKLGQHKTRPPAEKPGPEAEKPVYGPYEAYGPFRKSAG